MLQIGIVIFDAAEVLDFAGPYEVFATAARLCDAPPWCVSLISEKTTVMARGGFPVQSHFTLANQPSLDVLLVSGGVHQHRWDTPGLFPTFPVRSNVRTLVRTFVRAYARTGLPSYELLLVRS